MIDWIKEKYKQFIAREYRRTYSDRLAVLKDRIQDMQFASKKQLYEFLENQPELRRFLQYANSKIKRKDKGGKNV